MKNVDLRVEGMSCGLCVKTIEGTLCEIGAIGIVDLESAIVTAEFDENNLSVEKIKEAIGEQGFKIV